MPTSIEIELSVVADEMENLTDWEQQFVESLADQYGRGLQLSKTQTEKLHQIYEKVV